MGLDLLVEFEFRTTRPTGVLLGISSQKMDGMGIEMIDEKVSEFLQPKHSSSSRDTGVSTQLRF